jgi:hypothetical protein
MLNVVLAVIGALAGLFLLDRLLLRLEAAGHLYYRKSSASPGTLSSAMNSVQGVLEPGRRHAAEVRREQHVEVDKQPGGPPPGVQGTGLTVAQGSPAPVGSGEGQRRP